MDSQIQHLIMLSRRPLKREVAMRRRTQLVFITPALSASAIVTAVAALSFWLRYAL